MDKPKEQVVIRIEEAGCDGKIRTHCSFCGKKVKEDDRHYTCTHTRHVMLCPKCYRKAGTSVR
jgi:hypothetical protein